MLIAAFKALRQCYPPSTRLYSVLQRDALGRELFQIHGCQVLIYRTLAGGKKSHISLTSQVVGEHAVFRSVSVGGLTV